MSTARRPPMSALLAGDPPQVGPFRVHGRLGAGGMGVVYGATGADGRWVALKLIRGEFTDDSEFRDRFAREVDLMRRVGSRSIAPVIAADTTREGQPWYASTYVAGPTLQQRVKDNGALGPGPTEALAAGLAEAIAAIHAAGVVHRDLKPANVILAEDGPKVLDFGIARALDESAITRTGGVVGSPGWMSPERFRGYTGPEADVFAWGALVAYAATGRAPFGTGSAETLMYRVLNENPDLSGLPSELAEGVTRALAKDAAHRPGAADLVPLVARSYGVSLDDEADATDVAATIIDRRWTLGPPPTGPSSTGPAPTPGPVPPRPSPPHGASGPATPHPRAPAPPGGGGRASIPPPAGSGPSRSRASLVAITAVIGALALVVGVGVVVERVYSTSNSQQPGSPDSSEPGTPQAITIGLVPWDEGIAVTNMWQSILEEKGYDVEIQDVDVAPMFQSVAQGDIDVFMDAWLPDTHGEYWDEYGDQMEDVGTWYDGANLHLTVPEYVDEVDSIEDLPDNADLFGGEIVGIEAGSNLAQRTQNDVIPDYGLEDDYELVESSTPAMLSELDSAIAEEEPVLVTLWRPNIAYANHDLKDLEDPEGSFGEGEQIHTVAREGFSEDYSELNGWLQNFTMSDEELESLEEVVINEYANDEQEGARTWLNDNPAFVERTLGEDAEGLDFAS